MITPTERLSGNALYLRLMEEIAESRRFLSEARRLRYSVDPGSDDLPAAPSLTARLVS